MSTTLLALLLACSPSLQEDEQVPSANGRFVLEVTARSLALREKGAAAPLWRLDEVPLMTRFVVADSGAWVAALHLHLSGHQAAVTLHDATGKATDLRLLDTLSEEEQQYLEHSSCGLGWLATVTALADTLTFEVVQGGNRRPTDEPGPTVVVTLDARRGTVTRGPPVPRPGVAALIREHQREGKPGMAFQLLRAKAQLTANRGDRALCGFFAPFTRVNEIELRRVAIEALAAAACEPELSVVAGAGPRGDDGDLATLEWLERRDLVAAGQFALQALRGHKSPPLLRARGALLLIKAPPDGSPQLRWEAARLALADEDAFVRSTATGELTRLPRSQEAFSLLLQAASDGAEVLLAARMGLLQYLEARDEPAWRLQLADAEAQGRLERWPGGQVVAAALAEQRGEVQRAEALYRKATAVLDSQLPPAGRFWADGQLWCEAKLRLAHLAADQGNKAAAMQLASEVLASRLTESVAAPQPNRYAGGSASRNAQTVAQELITSGGAPPPKPPEPFDAMRQFRMVQKMIQEQRERAQRNSSRSPP